MRIDYEWYMPNSDTFQIKPIKKLLSEEMCRDNWIWYDPFARNSKIADITNDINPETDADYNLDAIDFLKIMFTDKHFKGRLMKYGLLLDWPYSPRQVSECYKHVNINPTFFHTSSGWWAKIKNLVKELEIDKVITFGWNSTGLGKNRGYTKTRLMFVNHGGMHNDTICVVEERNG